MSHKTNHENLLIDFNNLNVDDESKVANDTKSVVLAENNDSGMIKPRSMAFLCSSEPLYKLLGSESNDVDNNNPFDHLDKQACLSDDPFEIVENAALVSSDIASETGMLTVETGTLISIESPIIVKTETGSIYGTRPKDSVQNVSQKNMPNDTLNVSPKLISSPTGKNRSKAKNTSLSLLKYSISNSRLDLAGESGPHNEENVSGDEKTQKLGSLIRCESSADDSFDDIWATKPNLIDSQTDIDMDNDVDNDIAKLNIPMLNISLIESKSEEISTSNRDGQVIEESNETKLVNRSEILEKFAFIKQQIPQSPIQIDGTAVLIHNQTVNIKSSQLHANTGVEPVTPKCQYSSVLLPEQIQSDNPNSLIENLKKLVDQCNDKSKQTTAKHLLDDLSSLLNMNSDNRFTSIENQPPPLIKRQGTFSLEKNNTNSSEESKISDENSSTDSVRTEPERSPIDPGLSEVMKQIQNVLGPHQNINVLQSNDEKNVETNFSTVSTINPTYIVVMAQSINDIGEKEEYQRLQRGRSQSLTLKNKPLAAIRVAQHKSEQARAQSSLASTPIKRPVLQRRSSFGTIIRTKPNTESEVQSKPSITSVRLDAPKIIKRCSLGPSAKQPIDPMLTQIKHSNLLSRRRSFQSSSTTSGIRSPSPMTNLNSSRVSHAPIRLNCNTTGTLTRRKSFASDSTKESPQKIKTSYGIMKKPSAPPAARNLKIRVSQTVGGRSTAPLRAIVPMNRVASLLLINESVSPLDDSKNSALITSTPRSIPSSSPAKSKGIFANYKLFLEIISFKIKF